MNYWRKRECIITTYGKLIVEDEIKRLEELIVNGKRIVEEELLCRL